DRDHEERQPRAVTATERVTSLEEMYGARPSVRLHTSRPRRRGFGMSCLRWEVNPPTFPNWSDEMKSLKYLAVAAVAAFSLAPVARMQTVTEAPAGFDNLTNGHTDQATFDANKTIFQDVETVADGLGPIFNENACSACHQNPVTGGISEVSEFRSGHRDAAGNFVASPGGSLIHSSAIDPAIQEEVLDAETVRTFRMT